MRAEGAGRTTDEDRATSARCLESAALPWAPILPPKVKKYINDLYYPIGNEKKAGGPLGTEPFSTIFAGDFRLKGLREAISLQRFRTLSAKLP